MKEIKQFIEDFAKTEAELLTLQNKIDLVPYNKFLPNYYSYFVERLNMALGYMEMEPRSKAKLMILGDIESLPPCNPRYLFKISKYSSAKYGFIWVAYVSSEKPSPNRKNLTEVFFVIKVENEYKIAKMYTYSSYSSNGVSYKWEERKGYEDLSFESIEGPNEIERYMEPTDEFDGLKHYNSEM